MRNGSQHPTGVRTPSGTRWTPAVSWALIASVVAVHALWVRSVATAVAQVWARGENGLQLWLFVALPDIPIYALAIAADYTPVARYRSGDAYFWNYTFLYWLFLLGGSLQWGLLSWFLLRVRERRRHPSREQICAECGYDLRGSIESARCPECGTPFDPARLTRGVQDPALESGGVGPAGLLASLLTAGAPPATMTAVHPGRIRVQAQAPSAPSCSRR